MEGVSYCWGEGAKEGGTPIVLCPAKGASLEEHAMRKPLMICLVALSPLAVSSDAALAQSTCIDRCQGQSACLKRCVEATKRRPRPKQQYMAPSLPNDANERVNEWRERAFRMDGGSGGGGGNGGSM